MKYIISYTINIIFTTWLLLIIFSCTNRTASNKEETNTVNANTVTTASTKPPGTYPDTLTVNLPAAVFYHPDSLQLEKIKALTDTMVYEGTMHEYFFQMRNARLVIKKTWPRLTIIESKNYRYLLFIKKDGTREYIDLNTKNDAYGLFVFDGKKSPCLVDMTNIETEIPYYLKK